jgi:hypothetical protein
MRLSLRLQTGRPAQALQDIRHVVEKKLQKLVTTNPLIMDYYRRYQDASRRSSPTIDCVCKLK